MWRVLTLGVLVACAAAPRPAPVPVEPLANVTRTCADAAVGLERATKGVRAPESTVFQPMRERCLADLWPTTAIDCFAHLHEGELGQCAKLLPADARDGMFGVLSGGDHDRAAIAIARARLETLAVGIPTCDRFVSTVANVLSCERLPLETRVQLGTETADFWDLPTHGLPIEAQQRMAAACGQSLAALQQRAVDAGCMP